MAIVQSQCFSSSSSRVRCTPDAALLTRMSSRPNDSATRENSSPILSESPRCARDAEAVHTQGLYLPLRGRGGLVAAEVVEGDVRATASQLQRHGLPDAPGTARDQRNLTRQRC